MNKKIKRVIAMVLAVSAFSAIEPAKYLNLTTTNAYASSDDQTYLSNIHLSEGNLNFSEKKTSYTVKVSNSIQEIKVKAKANDSGDRITIDGSSVSSDEEKTVDLKKGQNTIKIKVTNSETGPKTYTVTVNRGSTNSTSSNSSSSSSTDTYLDSIRLSDGDISFSKKTLSYNIGVANSVNEIRITAQPQHDDSTVKIGGLEVNDSDKYRTTVSLSKGKNTIKIVVEDEHNNDRTYTLNIYKGVAVPTNVTTEVAKDTVDATQAEIYLEDLILNDGDIDVKFKPKVSVYDVNVKESVSEIIFKAEPEDSGDDVYVNDDKVDSGYRKRVYLKEGKNVVKIRVTTDYDKSEDNEERVYTVNVYRGTVANSTQTTTSDANTNVKINQWVNTMGKWQYNDAIGKPLTNTWYTDRNSGKTYYLQPDGYMATGWIYVDNNCYYLDESGAKAVGWKQLGANWYYLDSQGKMKTGWLQDLSGKWYYLYESGIMASNTTIGGYKLGYNGVLV